MLARIVSLATLGNRDLLAGVVYFLLGIAVLSSASFRDGFVQAQEGCGPGMQDCGGVCIPESDTCCPDGTFGSSTNCCCCSTEGSSSLATITCVPDGTVLPDGTVVP